MEHGGGAGAVLIRIVGETGSTNADLLALSREGAAEGTWLRAERQSAGRGRQGREWSSPAGNLYASTLIRLRASDPPAPSLTLVAAVALHEAISVFLGSNPRLLLKWPNDLLLDGAKLSGILLEGAGDAVIAGFGVNVAHHPDLADRATTSLAAHGAAIDPAALLDTLGEAVARWLSVWRARGVTVVRDAWLERAHPDGTALNVRLPEGGWLEGLFDGLDRDGALLLRLAGGERRVIHAADVLLLP